LIDQHTEVKVDLPRRAVGRVEGQRIFMENGVFRVHTKLGPTDLVDPTSRECRCKKYEVELRGGQTYVIEQESAQFDPFLRIESADKRETKQEGRQGNRHAWLNFMPERTGIYIVYATCFDPAF